MRSLVAGFAAIVAGLGVWKLRKTLRARGSAVEPATWRQKTLNSTGMFSQTKMLPGCEKYRTSLRSPANISLLFAHALMKNR